MFHPKMIVEEEKIKKYFLSSEKDDCDYGHDDEEDEKKILFIKKSSNQTGDNTNELDKFQILFSGWQGEMDGWINIRMSMKRIVIDQNVSCKDDILGEFLKAVLIICSPSHNLAGANVSSSASFCLEPGFFKLVFSRLDDLEPSIPMINIRALMVEEVFDKVIDKYYTNNHGQENLIASFNISVRELIQSAVEVGEGVEYSFDDIEDYEHEWMTRFPRFVLDELKKLNKNL